jgi:hypothetical protein
VAASVAAPTRLNFLSNLPKTLEADDATAQATSVTVRLSWTAPASATKYKVFFDGTQYGGDVTGTFIDISINAGTNSEKWNKLLACRVDSYKDNTFGTSSTEAYVGVFTATGTSSIQMYGTSKWTVSLSGGRGGDGSGGYGTTIQGSTNNKYTSGMTLYIAKAAKPSSGDFYGGTGYKNGGDMSKLTISDASIIAGGGGGNGSGPGGAGGSWYSDGSAENGGSSYHGVTVDYDEEQVYQWIQIDGGGSGYSGGGGGTNFSEDSRYWIGINHTDGTNASGNTGGNGGNNGGYGGGGGGGWAGGGGGGGGYAIAYNIGRIDVGAGGGAGSSGANNFGTCTTYRGSATSVRKSGFAIIASYDDGT